MMEYQWRVAWITRDGMARGISDRRYMTASEAKAIADLLQEEDPNVIAYPCAEASSVPVHLLQVEINPN